MLAKVAMRLAAEQVRLIYRRYLELSGVNALRLRKMIVRVFARAFAGCQLATYRQTTVQQWQQT